MALMRYVGPYPEVRVMVAGTEVGNVENGGSIVVPDDLAKEVEWSEHWEDASADKAEKERLAAEEEAHKEALSAPISEVNEDYEPGMSEA